MSTDRNILEILLKLTLNISSFTFWKRNWATGKFRAYEGEGFHLKALFRIAGSANVRYGRVN